MRLSDVASANDAARKLRDARDRKKTLTDMVVIGVIVGHHADEPRPIELTKRGGGTGTLTSVGFPDDLQAHIAGALMAWCDERIANAEAELKELGVDLAA